VNLRKGYRDPGDYEPRQRGMVTIAADVMRRRGRRLWRDGDMTAIECPECGCCLRVRRESLRADPMLWCPCGYETEAEAE